METWFDLTKISAMLTQYAPKVLGAILTLIIGLWIIGILTNRIRSFMKARGVDESVAPFLASLISTGLKVMLLLSVAGMFGIETTSFIAIISAMAFAVGLALQGSLGHFASGVLILLFKPYKVGDLVTISGNTGVVEAIQVFNTLLLTPDNRQVIIPNGVVTSGVVINISGAGIIRVDMTFVISAAEDIDRARAVILEVAAATPLVLKEKPVDVFVTQLTDGTVHFAVRPWCKSDDFWATYFYMHENIKKAFDKSGVAAPVQHLDVSLLKAG